MQNNTYRKYRALIKISFKNKLAWGWESILDSLILMLYAVISIVVWIAVYNFTGVKDIRGITLTSTIVYFAVISAIMPFIGTSDITYQMSDDIKDGSIGSSLIRPMPYYLKLLLEDMSQGIMNLFVTIPVIGIVIVLGGLSPSLGAYTMFILYFVIAYAITTLIGFIIGSLALYLTDVYGIRISINWIMTIFGGGLLPLAFFPQYIEKILLLTPFPFLAFVPSATLTGMISLGESQGLLITAIAWIIVLLGISWILWRRMKLRINAVGV